MKRMAPANRVSSRIWVKTDGALSGCVSVSITTAAASRKNPNAMIRAGLRNASFRAEGAVRRLENTRKHPVPMSRPTEKIRTATCWMCSGTRCIKARPNAKGTTRITAIPRTCLGLRLDTATVFLLADWISTSACRRFAALAVTHERRPWPGVYGLSTATARSLFARSAWRQLATALADDKAVSVDALRRSGASVEAIRSALRDALAPG